MQVQFLNRRHEVASLVHLFQDQGSSLNILKISVSIIKMITPIDTKPTKLTAVEFDANPRYSNVSSS